MVPIIGSKPSLRILCSTSEATLLETARWVKPPSLIDVEACKWQLCNSPYHLELEFARNHVLASPRSISSCELFIFDELITLVRQTFNSNLLQLVVLADV